MPIRRPTEYGVVFGGSKTMLRGRVRNINRPSDVAGVYDAALIRHAGLRLLSFFINVPFVFWDSWRKGHDSIIA